MPEKDKAPSKEEVAAVFGAVLRRTRRVRGVTQEQLAAAGGVSSQFVSMLERGVNQPSLHTVVMMARGLGVDPRDLVGETIQGLNETAPSSP